MRHVTTATATAAFGDTSPPAATRPRSRPLNTERFVDQSAPAIYATLPDEGVYQLLGTYLYRILGR